MDFKSVGVIVVLVGCMVVISNRSTHQEIQKISLRVDKVEQEILVQVPASQRTVPTSSLDVECLSRNIFYEAGVEDIIGKYAVGQVTINRLKSNKLRSVCNVIYAKKIVHGHYVCQFSWACKARLEKPSGPNWEESKLVAEAILKDGMRVAPLENATHYHANYVKPSWADPKKVVWVEGAHIFYAGLK